EAAKPKPAKHTTTKHMPAPKKTTTKRPIAHTTAPAPKQTIQRRAMKEAAKPKPSKHTTTKHKSAPKKTTTKHVAVPAATHGTK
ncbi:hypothetical protein BGZ58_004475, partial [Dissophora ornata]